MSIIWLEQHTPFPCPETACTEPNGLLASGGDLLPERLLDAYQHGIFPWYNEGSPILWWSPNPRAVLFPAQIHISKSLQKILRKQLFSFAINTDFEQTITQCARVHAYKGTWLHKEMIDAYIKLHELGVAHSFETWQSSKLVGGVYGLQIGQVFCGESMFSTVNNASKAALVHLAHEAKLRGINLIDCQVPNAHTSSLGATTMPRKMFLSILKNGLDSMQAFSP